MMGDFSFVCYNRALYVAIAFMMLCDVSGETWLSFSQTCYLIGQETVTWEDARSRCDAVGAKLIHLDSKPEHEFIYGLINDNDNQYWVDARWDENTKKITWPDGSEVAKYLWISYEPNDTGECVRYYKPPNTSEKLLGDNPCSEKYSYICEKSPGIFATGMMAHLSETSTTVPCQLLPVFHSRSSVDCSRACLQASGCDGIVYRDSSCQLVWFTEADGSCSVGNTVTSSESAYRLDRCYSTING